MSNKENSSDVFSYYIENPNANIKLALKTGSLQHAMLNNSHFLIIVTDTQGVIYLFSRGAEQLLGYSADKVVKNVTHADLIDPKYLTYHISTSNRELGVNVNDAQDMEEQYNLTYLCKDGLSLPMSVTTTVLRDDDNVIYGYLFMGSAHITHINSASETKEAEQKRGEDLRLVVENVSDCGIFMLDKKGYVKSWSKGAEHVTGHCANDIIGQHFSQFYHAEEVKNGKPQKVLKTVTTKGSYLGESWWVNKNGSSFWASVAINAIHHPRGKLNGFDTSATHTSNTPLVSPREKLTLMQAKIAAEKANIIQSDFLSHMSHELLTPLNAILGFAQVMISDNPPPSISQKKSLGQILKAGWYLLKLINEILDLSVIESGKISMSQELVSLTKTLIECQSLIHKEAQQRDIELIFSHLNLTNDILIFTDKIRLKQILGNLLSNAIKYTQEGGVVVVSCEQSFSNRVRVNITIKDDGDGISAEKISQLFEPFHRIGQDGGYETGTGVGLTVAKRLVELMGGCIGVERTNGQGCVFWVELDVATQSQSDKLTLTTENLSLNKAEVDDALPLDTILYVEDNPTNLKLVELLIARRPSVRMLSAGDGLSGVALANSALPDVILMDINLPDISGIEAMQILQNDPKTAHIPIVAISANAVPCHIELCLKAGFFRYLTKPLRVKTFMETLDIALAFSKKTKSWVDNANIVQRHSDDGSQAARLSPSSQ